MYGWDHWMLGGAVSYAIVSPSTVADGWLYIRSTPRPVTADK